MALILTISLLQSLVGVRESVLPLQLWLIHLLYLTSEPKVVLKARQLNIPFNYQIGGTLLHLFALRIQKMLWIYWMRSTDLSPEQKELREAHKYEGQGCSTKNYLQPHTSVRTHHLNPETYESHQGARNQLSEGKSSWDSEVLLLSRNDTQHSVSKKSRHSKNVSGMNRLHLLILPNGDFTPISL